MYQYCLRFLNTYTLHIHKYVMLYFFLALLGMFQQSYVCVILFDHTVCFTTSIFLMNIEFHRLFSLLRMCYGMSRYRKYKYGMNNAFEGSAAKKKCKTNPPRCIIYNVETKNQNLTSCCFLH